MPMYVILFYGPCFETEGIHCVCACVRACVRMCVRACSKLNVKTIAAFI